LTAPLEASGLGKRYRRTWALENCSVRLPAGRVAALVGPNGAGKTTLLHLAVGLAQPTTGEIRVLGETNRQSPDLLARVGFVAQDTPLYKSFTTNDLVRMGKALNPTFDVAMAEARWRELGIPPDKKSGELSGGQRAQVALALALAKRPEILLLDEPLASLDPLARRGFLQTLMTAVAETGMTVLLSSHLLADLERVCDYLVVLAAGHVQLAGTADDLVAGHRVVRGSRRTADELPREWSVVDEQTTERESLLLVRTPAPIHDPSFDVSTPSLEELVLAYLAHPGAGALPGPEPMEAVR
jgi:ABC-2 type transport system ATP-binding protein